MLDPMLTLAHSLHSNKGVYALLLGSGVSRSAGIRTGWEITLDLIDRLAHMTEKQPVADLETWYTEKLGEVPDYSKILEMLAPTQSERQALLRDYFEPSNEEREQGLKQPQKAHRAIARLVREGYIRVIITTNFDRLIESALRDEGVETSVLSTTDAITGAIPLAHSPCTVIKLHGDYLDTRLKNTPNELESYDLETDELLDRILDEYGLIVCGWSAEWDAALRSAFERAKARRYTTYWCVHRQPSESAQRLIKLRQAQTIYPENADQFFDSLLEQVLALKELSSPHPLTAPVAVALCKRYLAEERYKIRLHDLIITETERVYEQLNSPAFSASADQSDQDILKRMKQYRRAINVLVHLLTTGSFWGAEFHKHIWRKSIDRIANAIPTRSGKKVWLNLYHYPALLLIYAGGLAAMANHNYVSLSAIIREPTVQEFSVLHPIAMKVNPFEVMEHNLANRVLFPNQNSRYTPMSDHLFEVTREPLRSLIPNDSEYERLFDRFEYFLSLVYVDMDNPDSDNIEHKWAPVGSYAWRRRWIDKSRFNRVRDELEHHGENWGPLQSGFFRGSVTRAKKVDEAFNEHLDKVLRSWH